MTMLEPAPTEELPVVAVPAGDIEPWSDPTTDDAAPVEIPPLSPRLQLVRGILLMVLIVCASLLFHIVILSHFQQEAAQQRAFSALRSDLASGVAATGPVDNQGEPVELGEPIARLEIEAIGLDQVVVYGTTSAVLADGPGLRRDTPFPGQAGVSVVMGRRGAYGGPFAGISGLSSGDAIVVTTGQGTFDFAVTAVRREGDPLPGALAPGGARLTLVTADGPRYVPNGVVQVDAEIVGSPVTGPAPGASFGSLPDEEKVMANDTSTLWALALWIQLLTVLAVGALWAASRWGRPHAWLVFSPPLLLVGLASANEFTRLLPNLF